MCGNDCMLMNGFRPNKKIQQTYIENSQYYHSLVNSPQNSSSSPPTLKAKIAERDYVLYMTS